MGTGSTSFLSLRDNVLFCILCHTPFPMMSDRAKLSKYVHNDIGYPSSEQCHFGPVAQHSLVLGSKIKERIYIVQCYTVTIRRNSAEKTFEKYINNPIEIQSEVLFQCESCIIYNLSFIDDFCPSLFPDCVFPLPYFKGFYFILPLIIWSFLLLL